MAETSLEWLLSNLGKISGPLRLPKGGMANAKPVVKPPCQIVITGSSRWHGHHQMKNVRCRCMVGTSSEPSARFYGYDTIGQAVTIEEALKLWKEAGHG